MGWPVVALGEVLEQIQRPTSIEPDEEYRLLGMRSQIGGPFLRETKRGSEISARTLNQVKAGDFIYSRLFAWQGSFGVIPKELDHCYVSNEFPIFAVDKAHIDPRFLVFWFGLPQTQRTVEADCFGSTPGTRNRYKEAYFLKLETPCPPLNEQQRIVARLDKVAGLVEEAQSLRQEIDREMLAVVQSTHFKLADVAERPFGEFIESWEDRVSIEPTERYPQIGLRGFAGGLFFKDAVQGSETKYKTFNRLRSGLLIVSQPKGWEGAVAVCDASHEGWYASPEYRTFRCKPELLDNQYLAALLPTPWFQHELTKLTRGQGARREWLRPEMLLDMNVRMPALESQRMALRSFGRLGDLRAERVGVEEDIGVLLPAMLDGVFSGESSATIVESEFP